jgi:hypothetical protein
MVYMYGGKFSYEERQKARGNKSSVFNNWI